MDGWIDGTWIDAWLILGWDLAQKKKQYISDLKQGGDQTQGFRQLRGIITFFYTY